MGYNAPSSTPRAARGFALLWALVFIAIVTVVAAFAAPYLSQAADLDRVQRSAAILAQVADAVDSFNLVVKRGGAAFTTPNSLLQLTAAVANGGTAGCTTQTFNATAVTAWQVNGPFGGIVVPVGGIWTPIGRINNAPSRTPNTIGTARTSTNDPYYVQIQRVDIKLARQLDLYVDHALAQAAGVVQYTNPAADSSTTLSYDVGLAHTPAC